VLGQEAAGIIEAVGPDVAGPAKGDRVVYAGQSGAYAEFAVAPADRVVLLPPAISFEVAAASFLKGTTAEYLIRRAYRVEAGQAVLIHAAAGGVGALLVQWAKSLGAIVIGAVGSEEKADLARRLGCHHVILYRDEDVAERVRVITGGEGVRVAYDSVGKATFEGTLASLGRRGCFVSFGNASGPVPAFEPLRLSRAGSLFFTRPTLADYTATPAELRASAGALFSMITSGEIAVQIGQRFKLADARAAHEALETRNTIGASVLLP